MCSIETHFLSYKPQVRAELTGYPGALIRF